MRVLVVEDEVQLADAVARGLRREGMAVDVAHDGDTGLEKALVTRYDVLVLDRDLPGMSGDDVLRHLAGEGALTRVLLLTAASSLADRVAGLELGADDYLGKPFAFSELVARVRALGRRATPPAPPVLRADGAVVSGEELLERVWDEFADPATTTVRVTVMTLRKKLGEPQVVQTVVGQGYRLAAP